MYRALGRLKLEPEAISSVSGGTWCSAVFVFAHGFQGCAMSTSQLLGAATAPAELTLEALEVMVPAASGLVRGDANEILRQLMEEGILKVERGAEGVGWLGFAGFLGVLMAFTGDMWAFKEG